MLYKNRSKFDNISQKIGKSMSGLGIHPDAFTLLSLIFAIITAYIISQEMFLIASVFFVITAFLDIIDGSVARAAGKATKNGAYLDTITDRYVEFFVLVGFLFVEFPSYFIPSYGWIFLILFGGMMTTYAKAAAKEKGLTEKEINGGILERSERLILIFIGLLLAPINILVLTFVIIILAVLTNITAFQRIYKALQNRGL